ncbi:MAG: aconitate hydratase AcnA [Conexivisphaerales archaeon]
MRSVYKDDGREETGDSLKTSFDFARDEIATPAGKAGYYNLVKLKELGVDVEQLPFSIRVLLENSIRHSSVTEGAEEAAHQLLSWPKSVGKELPFMPGRVLLQDYTGVPLIVDLAALRDAVKSKGMQPASVNSRVPVDLIVDHSVQVDRWAVEDAILYNLQKEYERNSERYSLLKWAQSSFSNMRIFPPGKGICHQVNLEYIATVISTMPDRSGRLTAFPDTVVGTDSHTPMVNGMAVLGWGVGGIEAEAVMLGQPYHMPIPEVVGVEIVGRLREGSTPTDVVLTITEKLRKKGVVGKFVEFFGEGYERLTVPDRATLGNMAPEYGATVGFSPIDENTLEYLLGTGREPSHVDFVRRYSFANKMFYEVGSRPKYSEVVVIDLSEVEPSIAGPRNPDERISIRSAPQVIHQIISSSSRKTAHNAAVPSGHINDGYQPVELRANEAKSVAGKVSSGIALTEGLSDGSVVIAAITSCTNTSNPTVMLGAGLLAKKLVQLGLKPKPYVKTSMAPGSRVVTDYLENSGLLPYLDRLGFNVVGYGCTTCIGNSGPLAKEVEEEIKSRDLYAVAVLSGNRNFDGRIHPLAKGSFLTSPMMVVAYAIAGRIDFDFERQPLGKTKDGKEVYLKDVWPTMEEIRATVTRSLNADLYRKRYSNATEGDEKWNSLPSSTGEVYSWQESSTYIRRPPWFDMNVETMKDILNARVLCLLEDKVTTDHISPAGSIPYDSPAGRYLREHGIDVTQFSTYGSRRGNHEVMVRGGFSNIRLKNLLAQGKEGGWTTHLPSGELMTIYDASVRYQNEGVPLIVVAGKEYGAGSSRDWAAKAPLLLGVRAVIAESFERIHRSNLIAMGILPLEFTEGQSYKSLGLNGKEVYSIRGLANMTRPNEVLEVEADDQNGKKTEFRVRTRIDNSAELKYFAAGGILPYVMAQLIDEKS